MNPQIDHFVWGVSDLEAGCAEIEALFGVAPEPGGAHPGLGTCNALLSFGPGLYFEIMAPQDPAPGSIGERLARLDAPGLVTWVLRSDELNQVAALAGADTANVTPTGPVKTERLTPQGDRLSWELLFLTKHMHGGLVPFYIDWQQSPHPSASAPRGGSAEALTIASAQAARLNQLFAGLEIEQTAEHAGEDALSLHLATPKGDVVLKSTPQSLGVLAM